jgi:hypothetical protein
MVHIGMRSLSACRNQTQPASKDAVAGVRVWCTSARSVSAQRDWHRCIRRSSSSSLPATRRIPVPLNTCSVGRYPVDSVLIPAATMRLLRWVPAPNLGWCDSQVAFP